MGPCWWSQRDLVPWLGKAPTAGVCKLVEWGACVGCNTQDKDTGGALKSPGQKSPISSNTRSSRAQPAAASSYSAHSTGRCRWGGSRGFSPPARTHAATLCEVSVYSLSLFLQNYTSRNYAKSNSKAYRLKQQTARKYLHLVDSTLRNY